MCLLTSFLKAISFTLLLKHPSCWLVTCPGYPPYPATLTAFFCSQFCWNVFLKDTTEFQIPQCVLILSPHPLVSQYLPLLIINYSFSQKTNALKIFSQKQYLLLVEDFLERTPPSLPVHTSSGKAVPSWLPRCCTGASSLLCAPLCPPRTRSPSCPWLFP